ncbi:TniQ family protein [Mycobacteroides abscessus subsp. abscessus]|uniref:TniQ family protein n=1 Tax=Mycobacteroides abscessus TaxID=36809 RepID=UPI00057724CE|nr:TniQ family protein [Mycobacteroides abscessus]MDO3169590.1 TniQ family protein [Mycobacteroides abscessus subsp. abscessus]
MLPTRIEIGAQEALDSFLERLAAANDLTPAELLRMLNAEGSREVPPTAFLMIRPHPRVARIIGQLAGTTAAAITNATLARFDHGRPLHLQGLDPRHHHSFRKVATQGWFPVHGSQCCPDCLAANGMWLLHWRLPISTVCLQHRTFLVTRCECCQQRFRSREHLALRPTTGPEQLCGNPAGLGRYCQHSVLAHTPAGAPAPVLETAGRVARAITGRPVSILGHDTNPRIYLAELRHLATLILHLAARPQGPKRVDWANELHQEAQRRTSELRGPRWGISPPCSARVRGQALAAADRVLGQQTLQHAGNTLAAWFELIADVPNGPASWLKNRTTLTQTMQQLIGAALITRHPVSRRIACIEPGLRPAAEAIPQLIDAAIYRRYFAGMIGGYEWTGRLYVSLCLSRAAASVSNWAAAAEQIGLDPAVGVRTARAASAQLRTDVDTFCGALTRASLVLPADRDFRVLESRIQTLASTDDPWFERWRTLTSPARKHTSVPYAITWMWCEIAQGLLDTSPAWPHPANRQAKAAYRVFRGTLPPAAQRALAILATEATPP